MDISFDQIIELLKREVESRVDYDSLEANIALSEQGMDSLDRLSFFLAVEEEYGVSIQEDQMDDLKTIDDVIRFVNSNKN